MQIPHFCDFNGEEASNLLKKDRHWQYYDWNKRKFNSKYNTALVIEKNWKRIAINVQHILKILVRYATSAMSQNQKADATFAIAEVAKVVSCPPLVHNYYYCIAFCQ